MWTQPFQYIDVQFVLICVSALLNITYSSRDDWYYLDQLLNIVMAIVVSGVVFLYLFFNSLCSLSFSRKFKVRKKIIWQIWHYMFDILHIPLNYSMLRRLVNGKYNIGNAFNSQLHKIALAAGVLMMIQQPEFLLMLFNYMALFAIIQAGILRPFTLPSKNRSEIMVEFSLLAINYHLLCLTYFVSEPWASETIRYSICSYITIILFINFVVIGSDLVRKWVRSSKCVRCKGKIKKTNRKETG